MNSDNNHSIAITSSSSSGDDNLLTADADDEHFQHVDYEYKNYHDNRAFQFHNNNTLTKGKNQHAKPPTTATKIYSLPIHDANALDVIVVQGKNGSSNYASGKLLGKIPPNQNNNAICERLECGGGGGAGKEKTSSICRHQRHQRRRKHNATQTPLVSAGWQQLGDDGSCKGMGGIGGVTCPSCLSICTISSCVKHAHCFHHGEQHIGAGANLAELTCHCHITHHCHQYSPSAGQSSRKGKHHNQRRQCRRHQTTERLAEQCEGNHHRHHHHQHDHQQQQQNQKFTDTQQRNRHTHHHRRHHHTKKYDPNSILHHERKLPAEGGSFKSSIDSSAEQLCQQSLRQSQCQEIAIEIDAATMTEDNGSTATSNFAYKMAKDKKENQKNYIHHSDKLVPYSNCRRASFNSNTTIETDELSRDDDDDDDDNVELNHRRLDNDEAAELTPHRSNSSTTPAAICYDLDDDNGSCLEQDAEGVAYCPYGVPLSNDVHNENVRIKRKRFLPNDADFCSSCSSCSCARCDDDNTSSCSSLDDDELADYNASASAEDGRPSHEFTVSAECHHCNLPRQSSSASTMGEADDEGDEQDPAELRLRSTRSVSSTHSRLSSESFCSCNSNSGNNCSCSCEECDNTSRMRTAREGLSSATEATQDLDELHSSTLTPLTNPSSLVSTPLADDAAADITIRSGNSNVFAADDASSLSQSAEFFSIASSNQQSHGTPTITPVHKSSAAMSATSKASKNNSSEYNAAPVKQCKHYSKHHRHKNTDAKQDGYL